MDRLILLRHGEARPAARSGAGGGAGGDADLDRELTGAGRDAAAGAGRALAGAAERPDSVLVSPAARTRATWDEARPAWSPPPPERVDRALYDMPPGELLRRAEAEGAACVMLVGHNPGLQTLAFDLAGPDPRLANGFPPGTAAVLAREDDGWRLVSVHRPGDAA